MKCIKICCSYFINNNNQTTKKKQLLQYEEQQIGLGQQQAINHNQIPQKQFVSNKPLEIDNTILNPQQKSQQHQQEPKNSNQNSIVQGQAQQKISLIDPPQQILVKQIKSTEDINLLQESTNKQKEVVDFQYNPQDYNKLKIALNPNNQSYFQLLSYKNSNIEELLCLQGQTVIKQQQNSKLHIIKNIDNNYAKFLVTYELPCSYSYFISVINNYAFKKQLSFIEKFQLLQSLQPNLKINYLKLKHLFMQKQLTYLKYTYGIDKYHWQVCITPNYQSNLDDPSQITCMSKFLESKKVDSHVNGKFYSVSKIQQVSSNLQIKQYFEIDLTNDHILAKQINNLYPEYEKYIQKLYSFCLNTYEEQIA